MKHKKLIIFFTLLFLQSCAHYTAENTFKGMWNGLVGGIPAIEYQRYEFFNGSTYDSGRYDKDGNYRKVSLPTQKELRETAFILPILWINCIPWNGVLNPYNDDEKRTSIIYLAFSALWGAYRIGDIQYQYDKKRKEKR